MIAWYLNVHTYTYIIGLYSIRIYLNRSVVSNKYRYNTVLGEIDKKTLPTSNTFCNVYVVMYMIWTPTGDFRTKEHRDIWRLLYVLAWKKMFFLYFSNNKMCETILFRIFFIRRILGLLEKGIFFTASNW